ncbi:MAG: hypothetical protein ACLPKI_16930 [Streptosporangiaceae bacterium]
MTEVYLHVGPVKTGSTFLQDLLWRHRGDLARQGYLHPAEHPNEMFLASNDVQDCAFVRFGLPEAAGAWAAVRGRIQGFPGPVILSCEILGWSTPEHVARIAAALAPARLHVVVMARSLAAILPSLWQEKIKMVDPDISWPGFLAAERGSRSPVSDAALIVARWRRHVPAARIHVITVPPPGAGRLVLLARFAAATGLDVTSWQPGPEAANESLDLVQAELIRRLNLATARVMDWRAQRRLVNVVLLPRLRAAPGRPGPRLLVPASERDWITAETARRIAALRASRAVIHGDLAELEPPPGSWATGPQPVTDAELLAEALRWLAATPVPALPDPRDFT